MIDRGGVVTILQEMGAGAFYAQVFTDKYNAAVAQAKEGRTPVEIAIWRAAGDAEVLLACEAASQMYDPRSLVAKVTVWVKVPEPERLEVVA